MCSRTMKVESKTLTLETHPNLCGCHMTGWFESLEWTYEWWIWVPHVLDIGYIAILLCREVQVPHIGICGYWYYLVHAAIYTKALKYRGEFNQYSLWVPYYMTIMLHFQVNNLKVFVNPVPYPTMSICICIYWIGWLVRTVRTIIFVPWVTC